MPATIDLSTWKIGRKFENGRYIDICPVCGKKGALRPAIKATPREMKTCPELCPHGWLPASCFHIVEISELGNLTLCKIVKQCTAPLSSMEGGKA